MADRVKTKRRYSSPRREQQAEETRMAILIAALDLFSTNGWKATTIAGIAAMAGVAPETVYSRFGTKRAILQAMVVAAMRGAAPETPFMDQAERRSVESQIDAGKMIDAFAADISTVLRRVSPVLAVVRSAAMEDADIRALYKDLHASRRRNLGQFAEGLSKIGGVRSGISIDVATAHIWSLASPELFMLWTEAGNGSEYTAWLAWALKDLLLHDSGGTKRKAPPH
ncbi:MAG: TetR/AcrR family transcriptional regulator [Devosia sp.]